MIVRAYQKRDLADMIRIWNEVVEEGIAFPQEDDLNETTGKEFFGAQSYCGVAEEDGVVVGLYILHPNNIGRCGHIANASYAVDSKKRGHHIGEQLVCDCLAQAKRLGFQIMQFNAVVKPISMHGICMNVWGLNSLGRSKTGFVSRMAAM